MMTHSIIIYNPVNEGFCAVMSIISGVVLRRSELFVFLENRSYLMLCALQLKVHISNDESSPGIIAQWGTDHRVDSSSPMWEFCGYPTAAACLALKSHHAFTDKCKPS